MKSADRWFLLFDPLPSEGSASRKLLNVLNNVVGSFSVEDQFRFFLNLVPSASFLRLRMSSSSFQRRLF